MQCEQAREHLSAYLDRELTAELSTAVRAHLDACADCRALLEDLRATADLLGRLPVHEAPEHLAEDVQREMERRSLLARAPAEEVQPHERALPIRRARTWPRALAVAATLLLAAGIGLFAWLGQQTGRVAPTSVALHEESLDFRPGDTAPSAPAAPVAAREPEAAEGALVTRGAPVDGRALRRNDKAGVDLDTGAARGAGAYRFFSSSGTIGPTGPAGQPDILGSDLLGAFDMNLRELDEAGVLERLAEAGSAGAVAGGEEAKAYSYFLDGGTHFAAAARPPEPAAALAKLGDVHERFGLRPADATVVEKAREVTKGAERDAVAVTLADGDAKTVQVVMNYVAEGEVPVEELQAVATPANLSHADNQLVLSAPSRDEANKVLQQLFTANGWESIATEQSRQRRGSSAIRKEPAGAGGARKAKGYGEAGLAPGVYFLASRNGEDTWIVLTDRDNMSRFGTQLAQAESLTVAADSSRQFQAINALRSQLEILGRVDQDVASAGRRESRGRFDVEKADGMQREAPADGPKAVATAPGRPLGGLEVGGAPAPTRQKDEAAPGKAAHPWADNGADARQPRVGGGQGVRTAEKSPAEAPAPPRPEEPPTTMAAKTLEPATGSPDDRHRDVPAEPSQVAEHMFDEPAEARAGPSARPAVEPPALTSKEARAPAAPAAGAAPAPEPEAIGKALGRPAAGAHFEQEQRQRESQKPDEYEKYGEGLGQEVARREDLKRQTGGTGAAQAGGRWWFRHAMLPENQVLLIVRVRQVPADTAATAVEAQVLEADKARALEAKEPPAPTQP